jgi:hypothetical protein
MWLVRLARVSSVVDDRKRSGPTPLEGFAHGTGGVLELTGKRHLPSPVVRAERDDY